MSLIRHRRRTHLLCKETGKQKWTGMLVETGKAFVDPSTLTTQVREDSDFWSLSPLTILCWRTLLVITKHREDGPDIAQLDNTTTKHHNQVDYILVRKRFRSGVNIARARSFPRADVGSDNDLLIMTFRLRLKKSASQKTQNSSLPSKSWKIATCWKPSKL